MPTFEITGEDGSKYRLEAPDERAAASAWKKFQSGGAQPGEPPPATPAKTPVTANSIVRSTASGVPIIGGLLNKANAATNAALAPIVEPFLTPSENDISRNGESFGERYTKSLAMQDAADKKFSEEHPELDTAAKIAGGVGATVPVAATALGARALGAVGGSLPKQIGAGALSGSAIGAADAATRGEDIETGAKTGAIFGGAGPVVGRAVGKAAEAIGKTFSGKTLPTTEEIKDAAEAGYEQLRKMKAEIRPEAINSVAAGVARKLTDDGLRDYLAPKTFKLLEEMAQPAPNGASTTFADIHGIRRVLGAAAKSPDATEKMAATTAIRALDDYLSNIPAADVISGNANAASQIFRRANQNYAAAKRSDLVNSKIAAAEDQAGSANSGANIDNALRQRVRDILKSDKLRRGFSQDEILQMQQIVRGTAPGNVVRTIGNILGGGGGLGSMVSAATGAMTAGPVGALAPLAGMAVKKTGNAMTARQVDKLDEMIRARAPASETAVTARAADEARWRQMVEEAGRAGVILGPSSVPAILPLAYPTNR